MELNNGWKRSCSTYTLFVRIVPSLPEAAKIRFPFAIPLFHTPPFPFLLPLINGPSIPLTFSQYSLKATRKSSDLFSRRRVIWTLQSRWTLIPKSFFSCALSIPSTTQYIGVTPPPEEHCPRSRRNVADWRSFFELRRLARNFLPRPVSPPPPRPWRAALDVFLAPPCLSSSAIAWVGRKEPTKERRRLCNPKNMTRQGVSNGAL